MTKPIPYAMIGGGDGAFIGAVHRHALALDGRFVLAAGALASTPERARASGERLGLPPTRNYPDHRALLAGEAALGAAGARLIVIVTPNHTHHAIARDCVDAGFHVACDKPLTLTSAEADDLSERVRARGTIFAVTYNYGGYPMVREAAQLVRSGALGPLRKVVIGYHQGWLATALEAEGSKQATWRTDPARAGAGALGDIGSHAENLLHVVTGLTPEAICADVGSVVPGRRVDDDAQVLLRLPGGVRGAIGVSQVAIGHDNDLTLAVYGARGALRWAQESPNELHLAPLEGPAQRLVRGHAHLGERTRAATRLPAGHPEGFIEAFANVYAGVADAIGRHERGLGPEGDYPNVADGARGVRFIERALASARSAEKWTAFA